MSNPAFRASLAPQTDFWMGQKNFWTCGVHFIEWPIHDSGSFWCCWLAEPKPGLTGFTVLT